MCIVALWYALWCTTASSSLACCTCSFTVRQLQQSQPHLQLSKHSSRMLHSQQMHKVRKHLTARMIVALCMTLALCMTPAKFWHAVLCTAQVRMGGFVPFISPRRISASKHREVNSVPRLLAAGSGAANGQHHAQATGHQGAARAVAQPPAAQSATPFAKPSSAPAAGAPAQPRGLYATQPQQQAQAQQQEQMHQDDDFELIIDTPLPHASTFVARSQQLSASQKQDTGAGSDVRHQSLTCLGACNPEAGMLQLQLPVNEGGACASPRSGLKSQCVTCNALHKPARSS